MEKNNVEVTFLNNPMPLVGKQIKVGDKAPNFVAVGAGLKPVSLSDFDGKVKVIAIYPSIDTGVCQAQNRKFNKIASEKTDVVVISISCDLPFAQGRFCATEGLNNIVTISDHKDLDFGSKYGYIMEPLRLMARGTVIIDKNNVVQFVEYAKEVTTEPDYDGALKVISSL